MHHPAAVAGMQTACKRGGALAMDPVRTGHSRA